MKKWIQYLSDRGYTIIFGRNWKAYKEFCLFDKKYKAVLYDSGYRIELIEIKSDSVYFALNEPEKLAEKSQELKNDCYIATALKEQEK